MTHFQERLLGEQVIREMKDEEIQRENMVADPCQDQQPWIDHPVKLVPGEPVKVEMRYMVTEQQRKCLNGEHEVEAGEFKLALHECPAALRVCWCRHCRSLFVPRDV